MTSDTYFYIFLTAISILISKKFGSVRNIGFAWSVIFSIFCPLLSFLLIFLSLKKIKDKAIPNIAIPGMIVLAILILIFVGGYPRKLYEALGSITLPFFVFKGIISAEKMGAMSFQNFLTIFPIYALLRKYTSKYWS